MADTPIPDWDNYPDLDGVITTADVEQKGGGKFAATYVNHMKVAQLLRKHATGWQFELRTTTDEKARETHVFRAPDGSGYVVGFFRAPTGSGFLDTPDMVHAVMDHTMKPKKWEEITARDVTDTERRAMCVIAARHFGLAYELWAKDPIEDPYREEEEAKSAPKGAKPKAKRDTPAKQQSVAKPEVDPLEERRARCQQELGAIFKGTESIEADSSIVDKWRNHMKGRFNGSLRVEKDHLKVEHLTTAEMVDECEAWISTYPIKTKAKK